MKKSLRLMIIDDSEEDARLIVQTLMLRGSRDLTYERVNTAATIREALDREAWDMIIADYNTPQFNVLETMRELKERELDPPFILVSGSISEEKAGQAMKAGVHDYIMKDNLRRLVPAVERELREAESRRERARVEEALRESEERYRLHFESMNDILYSLDQDFVLTSVSPSVKAHLNYLPGELIGRKLSDLNILAPESLEQALSDTEKVLSGRSVSSAEYIFVALDQTRRFYEVSVAPLRKEKEIFAATAVARDISERKNLEEQLLQSQKMEAIGRLAGGVAHDFNNLLTAITGHSDLLLSSLRPHDPLRRQVDEIKRALKRATGLTRQLLAFSSKQMLQPIVLNLNEVVAEMDKMLRRVIGEDIELITIPGSDIGSVKADPGQIEQVIMNLALNARDAMGDGGKLIIETTRVELGADYVHKLMDVRPGPYVMLAMSDNGCGMDEETRAQIFEPFFTTKENEKGTGLGLSTVYGIVKQSGGHIWVYSEPWVGTSFKIYLPRVKDTPDAIQQDSHPAESLGGSETVLLVEDEESVRKVVLEILQKNGYRVMEAPNPGEAILIAEQHTGFIHLLLTDVVMPRMSAPDLAERLVPWHPEMKVLFMSGYTDSAIVRQGVLESGAAFLQKPFSPEELLKKIRQVLENPKAEKP